MKFAKVLIGGMLVGVGALAIAAPPAPARSQSGAQVYQTRCAACHSPAAGTAAKPGPHMAAIMGRRAASVAGYAYSTAMRSSGIVWTEAKLREFLAAPIRAVPGTKMTAGAVTDPQALDALIAHLKTLR